MSMYYDLVCTDCKERLATFRNGMICDAKEEDIHNFIMKHQSHYIILINEHESDELVHSKESYMKGFLIGSGT